MVRPVNFSVSIKLKILVSLYNRTAERRGRQNVFVCDKRDRAITFVFCHDLHKLMFSGLFLKNLFNGG